MRDPIPPVAGIPAAPPPQAMVGNTGPTYGIQARKVWAAGDVREQIVCDTLKAQALWRFSAFGAVYLEIAYGTHGNRKLEHLRAPLVMTIPGQFVATAVPVDSEHEGVDCVVTLTQATAGARSQARKLADATGGVVELDNSALSFVALVASTLTVAGVAVTAPALSVVPLVAGSTLDTGSGLLEFEA